MKIVKSERILDDVNDGVYDALLVPMSIYNSMNSGFVYDVGINFKRVREEERKTPYGDKRKYGTIYIISGKTDYVMCYIHNGGYNKDDDGSFISYDNLRRCLILVNDRYKGEKVASVIMGSDKSDGNGDKEKILKIFEETCADIDLTLYDYEQMDTRLETFHKIAELREKRKNKTITSEEYVHLRSKLEWERRNGRFTPMPEGYRYKPKGKKIG